MRQRTTSTSRARSSSSVRAGHEPVLGGDAIGGRAGRDRRTRRSAAPSSRGAVGQVYWTLTLPQPIRRRRRARSRQRVAQRRQRERDVVDGVLGRVVELDDEVRRARRRRRRRRSPASRARRRRRSRPPTSRRPCAACPWRARAGSGRRARRARSPGRGRRRDQPADVGLVRRARRDDAAPEVAPSSSRGTRSRGCGRRSRARRPPRPRDAATIRATAASASAAVSGGSAPTGTTTVVDAERRGRLEHALRRALERARAGRAPEQALEARGVERRAHRRPGCARSSPASSTSTRTRLGERGQRALEVRVERVAERVELGGELHGARNTNAAACRRRVPARRAGPRRARSPGA